MNKKDLAAQLAERADISHVAATKYLNILFDADSGIIANALDGGDKVLLAGFATFEIKERKGRVGTNPATGDKMSIAPKKYVAFKAGKTLKERISG
jgi:nucleoid DNA-binding protein